jgi:dUTP pyrophosphatase
MNESTAVALQQKLGIFCLHDDVELPTLATKKSACFDLKAYFNSFTKILAYDPYNTKKEIFIKNNCLLMSPGWRYLIPTGIIFDIPKDHYIKIHPRSGNALKKGLITANNVGIIDEDFVEECNCIMINVSYDPIQITHGDRIAQAELRKLENFKIDFLNNRPNQKTDREGGFGSTGT